MPALPPVHLPVRQPAGPVHTDASLVSLQRVNLLIHRTNLINACIQVPARDLAPLNCSLRCKAQFAHSTIKADLPCIVNCMLSTLECEVIQP